MGGILSSEFGTTDNHCQLLSQASVKQGRIEFENALKARDGILEFYLIRLGTYDKAYVKSVKQALEEAAREVLGQHVSVSMAGSLSSHTQVPGSDLDFFVWQTNSKTNITRRERSLLVTTFIESLEQLGWQYQLAKGEVVAQLQPAPGQATYTNTKLEPIDIAFQCFNGRQRNPPRKDISKSPIKFLTARCIKHGLAVYNTQCVSGSDIAYGVNQVVEATCPRMVADAIDKVLQAIVDGGLLLQDGQPWPEAARNTARRMAKLRRARKG